MDVYSKVQATLRLMKLQDKLLELYRLYVAVLETKNKLEATKNARK